MGRNGRKKCLEALARITLHADLTQSLDPEDLVAGGARRDPPSSRGSNLVDVIHSDLVNCKHLRASSGCEGLALRLGRRDLKDRLYHNDSHSATEKSFSSQQQPQQST
ncbi:hypothetical protein PtA15_14A177 [Puccinia triticina]|uniref:Uncharacterized protein n=1 Tax=Puccinia triticina TaxID=208348 RepID=A0ABY7D5N3_9BASI|nr:uncharacterized protein PtA15_14A177 [Puccinia triticina]WAQ91295.1 hypothetical protein PtA15_14A177 [Puccinia triticina]WAR62099.1 hypothetical protein PtB15_14B193 [Puccinia triticina]